MASKIYNRGVILSWREAKADKNDDERRFGSNKNAGKSVKKERGEIKKI